MRLMRALQVMWTSRRAGLLRLREAQGPTRLVCLGVNCGLCCRVLGGANVEPGEAAPFRSLKVLQSEGASLQLKCAGLKCALFREGRCSAYEIRPRACREYPWYNVGGKLYYDVGCPGIRTDADDRPDVNTLRRVEEYLEMFPGIIRASVVRLLTVW
jgi:Fe-S-cluster containining protein